MKRLPSFLVRAGYVLFCIAVFLVSFGADFKNPTPVVRFTPPPAAPQGFVNLQGLLAVNPLLPVPSVVRQRLGLSSDWNGAGETIAIVEDENGFTQSAFNAFSRQFGLPMTSVIVENATGQSLPPAQVKSEAMLDVEWAHVVAPDASLAVVVWGRRGTLGMESWLAAALNTLHPASVAMSWMGSGPGVLRATRWGDTSEFWPLHAYPTFVSSGDHGSEIGLPAMLPYVTAVGGLDMTQAGQLQPWVGSGTGVADFAVARPPWQGGFVSSLWRATPDVAWLSVPGVPVYANGWIGASGTSLAAPMWAALWAIVDQARRGAGLSPLTGPATPTLYAIARKNPQTFCLPSSNPADISCGPGGRWLPGVGLGWPNTPTLIQALTNAHPTQTHFANRPWAHETFWMLIFVIFALPWIIARNVKLAGSWALSIGGTHMFVDGGGHLALLIAICLFVLAGLLAAPDNPGTNQRQPQRKSGKPHTGRSIVMPAPERPRE